MKFFSRLHQDADLTNKKLIIKLAGDISGLDVIELGPGGDGLIQKMYGFNEVKTKKALEYYGQGEAIKKYGVDVRECDLSLEKWPIESNSVDLIISNQVLEHLPNTDHFFKELNRISRKDGIVILSTPNLGNWFHILLLIFSLQPPWCFVSDEIIGLGNPIFSSRYLERRIDPTHGHMRLFTLRALIDMSKSYGFEIIKKHGGSFGFPIIGEFLASIWPWHSLFCTIVLKKSMNYSKKL